MQKLLALSLIAISLFATTITTSAQAENKVAVVDVKLIVQKALAAANVTKQAEAKRDELQKRVTKMEEKLRKQEKELVAKRGVIAKEAFDKKQKEFQEKVIKAQKDLQADKGKLDKAYVAAMSKVRDKMLSITKDIAKENDYSAVLQKANLLFFEESIDISAKVLEKLNKDLPKVKLTVK